MRRSCCCLEVEGGVSCRAYGLGPAQGWALVVPSPPRPSQEQPREEFEGRREQRAVSAAVGWGPGLAGGGHMVGGGHNAGREAWDDWGDCKNSKERETVSRVTVGKAPLSFHIREVVKSVVRPGPDSVLHRPLEADCRGLGSTVSPVPQVTHSTPPPSFPTGLFSAFQAQRHKTQKMNIYYCTIILT